MVTATSDRLAVVVMAKAAVPGRVKTRLIPRLGAEGAAAVHSAMLDCVLERLVTHLPGRHVLAWADADDAAATPAGWETTEQGPGDLGHRLGHVWQAVGGGRVAFFGVDSPDAPAAALAAIPSAVDAADVALGPAEDGGYWTLAARRFAPTLLSPIDWGTSVVYDQTSAAARSAGLSVYPLPRWHDVDDWAGLTALRARLENTDEPPLARLRERLGRICETHG